MLGGKVAPTHHLKTREYSICAGVLEKPHHRGSKMYPQLEFFIAA